MKAFRNCLLAATLAVACVAQARSSAGDKLVGAWHLLTLEEPAPDGTMHHITDSKGSLIYTRDGHMSVQLMLPKEQANVSNDYVQNGYEASFGTYTVNQQAHTVTHHVEGSVTRGLVGKDLARKFMITGGRLVITSTRADEHWSVTWEHD